MIALAGTADVVIWLAIFAAIVLTGRWALRTIDLKLPAESAREALWRDGADMGKAKDL